MKILIAGDFAPHGRVAELYQKGTKTKLLEDSLQLCINDADYSIVNMESPIINGSCDKSIPYKINLSATSKAIEWLKEIGFDCVTLANNHIRDYHDTGVINSLTELDRYNIDRVGADVDLSSSEAVLYKEIKGKILALINVCENEFSVANTRPGAAPLDMIDNYHQIVEARKNADYVVMIVHGGHEHYQLPSPRMKKTYEWFIELGADAVINHHQHCFSGIELYRGKPIFYGIGNFCFDWPGRVGKPWNYGFLVCLNLGSQVKYVIEPYCQCDKELIIRPLNKEELTTFNNKLKDINEIIDDDNKLAASFTDYCRTRKKGMELALTPYSKRLSKGLFMRNLLPGFVTDIRRFFLYDYVNCEAHRDVLLNYLKDGSDW